MRKERIIDGKSSKGELQDALEQAFQELNSQISEDGVRDATAAWRVIDISGEYGGVAGFQNVNVKIMATRTPDWIS
jgi:hypothetical protein